jgi:UDP-2,3-diacylglucosamine pyrophosphatase LpxH
MSDHDSQAAERRIIVVSDLHIMDNVPADEQSCAWEGCDIFDSAAELGDLIEWLDMTHAAESKADLELVLNGDSFDFLAEEPFNAPTCDPELAARRMETAMEFAPQVCSALDTFLDSHKLTVIVGDRDKEITLPSVQLRFIDALGAREDAVRFISDTEPYRVGRLWIEHGHSHDPWRIIDRNGVRILRIMLRRDERVRLRGSDLRRLTVLLKGQVADNEWAETREDVYQVAAGKLLSRQDVDLVVLGHSHRALRMDLPGGTYLNTGTWVRRPQVPQECPACTESALERLGECIDGLLDGTFDDWIVPQLNYADIRLTENGEVKSARLCEFDKSLGGTHRLSQ